MYSTARTVDPEVFVYMADLDIKMEKVRGEFTFEKRLNITEKNMIENAIFGALDKVKADFIVGLQTQVSSEYTSTGKLKAKKVIVTGYPAYFKNIRPVPKEMTQFTAEALKSDTPYIIRETIGGEEKSYVLITTTNKEEFCPVLKLDPEQLSVDHLTFKNKKGDKNKEVNPAEAIFKGDTKTNKRT
jgi:hypothetical protein